MQHLQTISAVASVTNLDPMNRGLKRADRRVQTTFFTQVTNLDPMNRGLKLGSGGGGRPLPVVELQT